MALHWVIRVTI